MSYKKQELLTIPENLSSPLVFGGVRVAHLLVFYAVILCVLTFRVPCFDVRYYFRIERMFGSSLPPVVCRKTHVLFTLFVFVFI